MTSLVLIDLQKGMCDPSGSAGANGLAAAVASSGALNQAGAALAHARDISHRVVHVRLAFDPTYGNRTNATERFAAHQNARRFAAGSFDTQWADEVVPTEAETVVNKGSVSPFASTALLATLARWGETHLVLAGVATHLAVESAAREAADRGFAVQILSDACAAPANLHQHSITNILPAFASVTTVGAWRGQSEGAPA